jgi:hypothetical protein
MSSNKKKRRDSYNDLSDDDYDDDAECGKYKVGGVTYETELEYCRAQVEDYKKLVKSLELKIRVMNHTERQTKRQMRIDYEWDGEESNISDKVSEWVKGYLFPRYKFLKDGWMEYREEDDSLSSFTQERLFNGIVHGYEGLWNRVICPTINMKYVTIRCNLNNEV